MSIEDIKKSIGILWFEEKPIGTGFLISPELIITAHHNIKGIKSQIMDINIQFTQLDSKPVYISKVELEKENHDIAILRLNDVINDCEPIKLTVIENYTHDKIESLKWKSWGYHDQNEIKGLVIFSGQIEDLVIQDDQWDILITCKKDNPYLDLGGISGSPLVVEGRVIGILLKQLNSEVMTDIAVVSTNKLQECLEEKGVTFRNWYLNRNVHMNDFRNRYNNWINLEIATQSQYLNEASNKIEHPLMQPWRKFKNSNSWGHELISIIDSILIWKYEDEKINILKDFKTENIYKVTQIITKIKESKQMIGKYAYDNIRIKIEEQVKEFFRIRKIIFDNKQARQDRRLIRDIEKTREGMERLAEHITLDYNRLFLVAGDTGSGKSHLIREIFKEYSIQSNNYYIKLDRFFKMDIEKYILKKIKEVVGIEFEKIEDLNEIIEKSNLDNIKIFFIIDNINVSIEYDNEFIDDIKKYICEYTKYEWLYWVLTVPIIDLDKVIENNDFFKKYSDPEVKDPVNGWIILDDLNRQWKIGHRIIEEFILEDQYNLGNLETWLSENEKTKNLLMNPFIAWILVNTVGSLGHSHEIVDLNFVKFIENFGKEKIQVISRIVKDTKAINEIIKLISDLSLLTKKEFYYEREILNYVCDSAKMDYRLSNCLTDNKFLKDLCNELKRASLLRDAEQYEDDGLYEFEKTGVIGVELGYKFYWAFKIANKLISEINNLEHDRLEKAWETLQQFEDKLLMKDVFEFFILAVDRKFNSEIDVLIDNLLAKNELIPSVYFVGGKASETFQKRILERYIRLNGKHQIFSYIYFISCCDLKEVSPIRKCKLLSQYYVQIYDYGLTSYYLYVIRKIIDNVQNVTTLSACMYHFITCPIVEITDNVGKLIADKMISFYKGQTIRDTVQKIVTFLELHKEIIDKSISEADIGEGVDITRKTFIQFFIMYIMKNLVSKYEFKVHKILLQEDWYYKKKLKENRSIIDVMRREVTLVYGQSYRASKSNESDKMDSFRNTYYKIINDLLHKEIHYKKLAFHFITSTVNYKVDPKEIVDAKFHPMLKKIYNDKDLQSFISSKKRSRIFINNRIDKL
jgi:hypothetical protein